MPKIAIIGCKNIQDQLCISCAKCLKAVKKKDGEFSRYDDDVEVVALGDCGGCPGLVIPKLGLLKTVVASLDNDFDTIHFGTCVKIAAGTAGCPMDPEKMKTIIEEKFGKDVVIGTHNY